MLRVSLRQVTPDDRDHLFRVYATSRDEELAIVPWTAAEKHAFLKMQFNARERDYSSRFDAKDHSVIERDGAAVGYVWVHRAPDELRVVDIALLPEHRNAGIGTGLMNDIIAEARERGVPVRLNVLTNSPARRLYERLGFQPVGEAGINQTMELLP